MTGIALSYSLCEASLVSQMVKNPPTNAGNVGSILGSGRSPGERNGDPLQYSCLENSMDRVAWWAAVHRGAKSQTQLKQFSKIGRAHV